MATAIIPILSAAAPLLTPLIQSLVVHVEHLFGAKTGQTKADLVVKAVTDAAQQLATAGKIPGQLDPASIATMVETVVQQFKKDGVLTPDSAAAIIKASVPTPSPLAAVGTVKIVGGSLQFAAGT